MARLKDKYFNEIIPEMMKKLGYKNRFQVPKVDKIVINMGVGEGVHDIKILETALGELALIAGQKPMITRARRSIANFKIKKGAPIGGMVTLRRARMYEFFDRLINVAIPRIKDFRGLPSTSFDQGSNYTLGLSEQIIFPEIDYDKIQKVKGMNITIVTTAKTKEEAYELLQAFGIPFKGTDVSDK